MADVIEYGTMLYLDREPTQAQIDALESELRAIRCTDISTMVTREWGDFAAFWQVCSVGNRQTPVQLEELDPAIYQLQPGVDFELPNPYYRNHDHPYFDRVDYAKPDLSLRALRVVLGNGKGEGLDIIITKRVLLTLMEMAGYSAERMTA